jgi:hypothetical protein
MGSARCPKKICSTARLAQPNQRVNRSVGGSQDIDLGGEVKDIVVLGGRGASNAVRGD